MFTKSAKHCTEDRGNKDIKGYSRILISNTWHENWIKLNGFHFW